MGGEVSLFAALLLVGGSPVAAPAAAEPSFEVERQCWDAGEEFTPEQQIAACNAMLGWDELSDDDRPMVIAMRGWSHAERGDYPQAIADFSETIRLLPDSPEGYGWRAGAYVDTMDWEKALADYTQAIRLGPEATDLALWYHDRGFARQELGAPPQEAIADYTKAINLAPDVASNWNSRCWARATWGRQLVEALDDCNEALALDPEDYNAWDSRGLVRLQRQEWDAALADYEASLDLETTASAYYGRGVALARLGRQQDAEANYVMATRLDPEIAATYAGFGIEP